MVAVIYSLTTNDTPHQLDYRVRFSWGSQLVVIRLLEEG